MIEVLLAEYAISDENGFVVHRVYLQIDEESGEMVLFDCTYPSYKSFIVGYLFDELEEYLITEAKEYAELRYSEQTEFLLDYMRRKE